MSPDARLPTVLYSWLVSSEVTAWVGWVGTLAGLLGLIITIAVYRSTGVIRRDFLISVRVPKQVDEIAACATVVAAHMGGADLNSIELQGAIARLAVISESLAEKLSSRETKFICEKLLTVERVARQCEAGRTSQLIQDLWVKTQAAVEAAKQWLEDRDWSKANGD
jgi:hypothetical protein